VSEQAIDIDAGLRAHHDLLLQVYADVDREHFPSQFWH
jgi:hypothetical protein